MKRFTAFVLAAGMMIAAASFTMTSCTKEGPQGEPGKDGVDANETCKQCHAANVVDAIAVEFELSKHNWGEAAFEEAGVVGCAACHEHKGFVYACANALPSTFTFNTTTGKWVNDYTVPASEAIGDIGCFTCHSELHTTYGTEDLALTNTAPVSMTMWAGTKTIDLAQGGGSSNLCVKCHQPRPLVCGNDPAGRVLNYDSIKNFPNLMMYDSTAGATTNKYLKPSYRMHVHYGAVGAVYAGVGAIEFPGSVGYGNSPHTSLATCQDCHMAGPMEGVAGGHSFNVRNAKESALGSGTTWNFKGCNVEGCHDLSPLDKSSPKWVDTRAAVKTLLDQLAAKINACGGGTDILHKTSDPTANLWAGITTNNYDGYLDIYSSSSNPTGYWRDPYGSGTTNAGKPKFPSLSFLQTGAIINFQFCLREYSLGIHNTVYVKALLTNTIEKMTAAGW